MNYQQSLDYLYGLGHETTTIKFGLENMQTLFAAFSHPQQSFLKVQIAGTNGKGSVCAFLDSICRAANLKVGLYTSPHLIETTERIKINNVQISTEKFAELATRVRTTAENLVAAKKLAALPTFFEHLTMIAILAFQAAAVDVAILETGLGGRLDATTAAESDIIGITPISLDHQEYLGNSLPEIAAEKAAIIRSNNKVVIALQESAAMQVILDKCKANRVQPILIKEKAFRVNSIVGDKLDATFVTQNAIYKHILPSLLGRHQLENASVAINLAEVLRDFGFEISQDNIRRGLETAQHAGRLELWTEIDPPILFDGAHNVAGAKSLKTYLQEFWNQTPLTFIFGAMRDKDLSEISAELFPLAQNLILTRVDNPRSAAPTDLQLFATGKKANLFLAQTAGDALHSARDVTSASNLIIVTGSLYLVGEIHRILNRNAERF